MRDQRSIARTILKVAGGTGIPAPDQLAIEEPIEIQIEYGPPESRQSKTIAVTMRTPGHDRELAAGFLVGEGILRSLDQVAEVAATRAQRVRIALQPGVQFELARLDRNSYTTSSCGVCGKTSLEALELDFVAPLARCDWRDQWKVECETICALPARLRQAQSVFDRTGGLHAAGLFTLDGDPVTAYEDVGRHNAVDKVVGAAFLAGHLPLSRHILVLSGRASFELMQKALAAGIGMLVAVGAPSSLAAEVAERFGATLIGFTKATGFNVYTGAERVALETTASA